AADGKTAQDEGASSEGDLLLPLISLLAHEADRLHPPDECRRRSRLVQERACKFPKARTCVFEHGGESGYCCRIPVVEGRASKAPISGPGGKRNCCSECCSISAVETRNGRSGRYSPLKESAI